MNSDEYFEHIEKEVYKVYNIAKEARKKGIDPVLDVESPIAMTLAEKAVGLISTVYPQLNDKKIVNRIIELEGQYGQLDMMVPFLIAEEIAKEKYCKFESHLQAMDAGIRVGFSYITIGVVSSPIEGFTELKIGKTRDGNEYLIANFSGPIRSAGTTASCMVLMLIDYLREVFGYAKYDPNEDEIKRYITENYDYHERVNNLQYLPTEEEIEFLAKNIPIQISGEPTEQREVSNYKDLKRVETNLIRGGMCLIFSEGLAQKAQKGYGLWKGMIGKGLKATGWTFLEEYLVIHKKREKGGKDTTATYIKDLVAGRPVFGHPSKKGGFRFRYGRNRVGGFSATSVSPATMGISDRFLSVGTQLKIEKPTKGCAINMCDEIEGPIVRMKDGSVKRLDSLEESILAYPEVEEIIHFGDLLISFGDISNRKFDMLKPGYVEEWWEKQLKKESNGEWKGDKLKVGIDEAVELSDKYKIPMHPRYIYFWKELSVEDLMKMMEWLSLAKYVDEKIILPFTKSDKDKHSRGKRALELIGIQHEVTIENIIIKNPDSQALLFNLGINKNEDLKKQIDEKILDLKDEDVLIQVNKFSKFIIKDRGGTYIGARMGRPEKAKLRKLEGSPHVLFTVGDEGGRLRSFGEAIEKGYVTGDFPIYYCEECKNETIYPSCEKCSKLTKKLKYSREEDRNYTGEHPDGKPLDEFKKRRIDIGYYYESARKKLGLLREEVPLVKGVRGTSNKDHSCEHLGKGILRAKYGLNVNKDGTIRYDMTEMAITHFKPKEINTSVEKLKSLGYEKDVYGNILENDNQIVEMFPHDIILPACPDSADENADDVFFKAMNFIDEELEKLYDMKRYFNLKKKEDMIGELFVCMAPHICTATVGRLIGFSKNQTLLASPFMHAAMRRDCDGDEAAAFLLFDLLLNFSRKFLPAHRGGTQDAPLVLNIRIRAGDVDDQILDFESGEYPLELYELAEKGVSSSEVKNVDTIKNRLKKGINPFENTLFTHSCNNINDAVLNSSYKSLPSMREKVEKMMDLCVKLRAVDVTDVSRLVIERHFIRDIRGNLRKFSQQQFRCVGCNEKYRRPLLAGKCNKCGGRLIFTISQGSIVKYMQPALDLARNYGVSEYLLENLESVERYIQSIFGKEKEKQENISKWF
jgi:DNA polymerase II large subunit